MGAAAVRLWNRSKLAPNKSNTDESKSIFIAGGVGTFAIMFAKQLGIKNIVTTAGNDKSLSYLVQNFQLKQDNIINYKEEDVIKKAIDVNGGYFDIALDLVGDKMLSAGCELLAIDGNLASVTEAPTQDDFETLFLRNASFHSIGANAYSFQKNRRTGNSINKC